MIRLKQEYEEAVRLRKMRFTYAEIAKVLGVSKSTVSQWLSGESWSKKIKEDNVIKAARDNKKRIKLLNKARGNQNNKLYAEAERSARVEYGHFKKDPLFIAGVVSYITAGERTKNHRIQLSSTDSSVHRLFIKFCIAYLGVTKDEIKFWMLLYPTAKEETVVRSWSRDLGITKKNWYKNQTVKSQKETKTLHVGVGNTIIGSTILKRKLLIWIELLLKDTK